MRYDRPDKVSPSVNYVHVKRIASIPCGHTSYLSLSGPLAVAITLEPLDIPTRIATILYLNRSLVSVASTISRFHFLLSFLFLSPPPPLFRSRFLSHPPTSHLAMPFFPINIPARVAFPSRFSNPETVIRVNRRIDTRSAGSA